MSRMKLLTHEQRRTSTEERSVENSWAVVGLKPVLFARDATFNSNAAPIYKDEHMFRPHMGPLPHKWNITVKHK